MKKKEVLVLSNASVPTSIRLGTNAHFCQPIATNLGMKADASLKLDCQLKAVMKCSFFYLRQLSKISPILPQRLFEIVIHAFITSQPFRALQSCTPYRSLRSAEQLHVPKTRFKFRGDWTFTVLGKLWNNLPLYIRPPHCF